MADRTTARNLRRIICTSQAFKAFKYGYGNAIGVVFIVICVLATVALNTIFRDKQEA